jgi:cupin fold WbuC family metalloprotein
MLEQSGSNEVYFAKGPIVRISVREIEELKKKAAQTLRKRTRLCAHKNESEFLQEMFIVHMKDVYVRPHKHLNKNESLHVLEGSATVVIFDEGGDVVEKYSIGDYRSGRTFYQRIPNGLYHSLLIQSEVFIFHECTTGPFVRDESLFAPWSPEEGTAGVTEFLRRIA